MDLIFDRRYSSFTEHFWINRSYLATVLLYRQSCDDFLKCIDDTVQLFSGLEGDYKFVEEQTRALQNTCEDLLAKQVNG
jgi:hypothetical protein